MTAYTPAIQQVISDIQALPRCTATESRFANQTTQLCSKWYDTIVFYRAGSYSAAAAAYLFHRYETAPTLYYRVSDTLHEPNTCTMLTIGAKLIFIDVMYSNMIGSILNPLARAVAYVQHRNVEDTINILGLDAPMLLASATDKTSTTDKSTRPQLPWWVRYHIAYEHKDFDNVQCAQYASYITSGGPPSITLFSNLTEVAPHTFFENAAPRYQKIARIVGDICLRAQHGKFRGYTTYMVSDSQLRQFVAHWLLKLPDCDIVMIVGTPRMNVGMRPYTEISLRSTPKKKIDVGEIARDIGGRGNTNSSTFKCYDNCLNLVDFS